MSNKVWCDVVHGTLIAKTKGTFNAIETNAKSVVISKPDAKSILGFLVAYAQGVTTDAENLADLLIQVNSKSLGISQEVLPVLGGGNDADANNEYTPVVTRFIPFKLKPGFAAKLFNSAITFKAAPSVTNTGGFEVCVGVVYSDAEPDSIFAMELLAQLHGRITGGDVQSDAAEAFAAAATAVTLTALTIPAGNSRVRAVGAKINPNGVTAGDPICGFFEFLAPGITDYSPQRWPLPISWNAALGTVAESAAISALGRMYPTRFGLPNAEITVQVQATITIVAATAPDTTQAILYE